MFKPNFKITSQIASALMQIEACRQAVNNLPIDAAVLRRLRETAALITIHFSTQIEGNRLTLPEVRAAIRGERLRLDAAGRREDRSPLPRRRIRWALLEEGAPLDRRGARLFTKSCPSQSPPQHLSDCFAI